MLPIRILHCVAGMGRGGYETFIMNLYRYIDRAAIQFDFISSLPGVYDEEIAALGGLIHRIPFITHAGPFAYAWHLARVFHTHPEYRIVHAHMDQFSGMVMRVAKRCGIPVRIAHSHNTGSDGNWLYRLVKGYYGHFIAGNCTHRLACGPAAARWLFRKHAPQASIIPNAIDIDAFSATACKRQAVRATFHLEDAYPVIGNIARFQPVKNHAFLLRVFARLLAQYPRAHLVLAGSGPLLGQMRKLAANMQLTGSVSFLEDCDDIPSLMQALDAFCLPSLYEGLGIVLIEAQTAGIPCVASNHVPPEAAVTELIDFLSLDAPLDEWVAALAQAAARPNKGKAATIRAAGYHVADVAKQMQQTYHTLWQSSL